MRKITKNVLGILALATTAFSANGQSPNRILKYNNPLFPLANSQIYESGTNITVGYPGTPLTPYKLDVNGTGRYIGALRIGAYTLPNTDGTAGQVLKTNGSGTLTWMNDAGGSYTASNGITLSGSDFQLGGSLSQTTGINFNDFNLNFTDGAGTSPTANMFSVGNPFSPSAPYDIQGRMNVYGRNQVAAASFHKFGSTSVDEPLSNVGIVTTVTNTNSSSLSQDYAIVFSVESNAVSNSTGIHGQVNTPGDANGGMIEAKGGTAARGLYASADAGSTSAAFAFGVEGGGQNAYNVVGVSGGATNAGSIGAGVIGGSIDAQNVGYGVFGSASTSYAGVPYYGVYSNGDIGYTGALVHVSDAKLKKNVKNDEKALDRIKKLQPRTYEYISVEESGGMHLARGTQHGFIAQELETVFPELVSEQAYGDPFEKEIVKMKVTRYKGINYEGMIPVLTKGIQEQQAIIESQEEKINELEARMAKMEQMMAQMNGTETGNVLDQNTPNPFERTTTISYQLAQGGEVSLMVYDMNGSVVATLVNQRQESGSQKVTWDAGNAPSGTYLYVLKVNGTEMVRKAILKK